MVYCSKCGKKNEDDAEFCAKCGDSLTGSKKDHEKECENSCEKECAGGKHHGPSFFWGAVVILIGLWILFEFVLKNIEGLNLPTWLQEFEFWWLFALIIAIAVIATGVRMLTQK